MVTVPASTMVRVEPLTVATFVSELVKLTVRPELAEAFRLTVETEVLQSGMDAKVMVWERSAVMVRLTEILEAAEK
jgi:hypothetical protein